MEMASKVEAAKAHADAIEPQLLCLNGLITAAAVSSAVSRVSKKHVWVHLRHEQWFEMTLPQLDNQNFKRMFRVSRATFHFITEKLRGKMERTATNMRAATSVEKRVAVGLYRLRSFAEDRTIALVFAVGRSSVTRFTGTSARQSWTSWKQSGLQCQVRRTWPDTSENSQPCRAFRRP